VLNLKAAFRTVRVASSERRFIPQQQAYSEMGSMTAIGLTETKPIAHRERSTQN
jgi:hypothetical protein